MANFTKYANSVLKPYYKYMTGLFLLALFILVAKFAYDTYFVKMKKNKEFTDVANAINNKPIVTVFFFFVDWCPHCKTAKPEWEKFKSQYNNKEIKGYVLKCYDVNCTEDNGDQVIQFDTEIDKETQQHLPIPIKPTPIKTSELVKKYNIDSYPTIKLTKNDLVVDFDAKVTKEALSQFINTV
jgi:thiol-disulfide isomerase/thioredoxin